MHAQVIGKMSVIHYGTQFTFAVSSPDEFVFVFGAVR